MRLAAIWQEVLGVDRVGVHDNFFDLGGHSLLSIHLINCIKDRLGWVLTPREILLNNLQQLADYCDSRAPVMPQDSTAYRPVGLAAGIFGKIKKRLGFSEA